MLLIQNDKIQIYPLKRTQRLVSIDPLDGVTCVGQDRPTLRSWGQRKFEKKIEVDFHLEEILDNCNIIADKSAPNIPNASKARLTIRR